MTELWTFEIFESEPMADRFDLTGWAVEAEDGHLGKVDEATYDVGRSYIVVDTGFWIFGKKRMIPAGALRSIDPDTKTVYVALTKEQVKQAPDYEEVARNRGDDEYMQRHTEYYVQSRQPRSASPTKRGQN